MTNDLWTDTRRLAPMDDDDRQAGTHCLTVAYHPQLSRIGERAALSALRYPGTRTSVSRLEPAFGPPGGARGEPLGNPFISRRPFFVIAETNGDLVISTEETSTPVSVNGAPPQPRVVISPQSLSAGVVLEVAGQVVLVLSRLRSLLEPAPAPHGLVGESDPVCTLRAQISRVAASSGPVLIRGETGSGKELVAQAIHAASNRRSRQLVTINMSAIPPSLASSELFGHGRGAFSGAGAARDGYFVRADRGSLFLDEIGDTPPEVQPLLLRALETGEIQPVGVERTRRVDVRLIAATDADLETAITEGNFRAPLLYRLATHELRVPPLRERRDDVGRLLRAFLERELSEQGQKTRLDQRQADGRLWLPAEIVARLCLFAWPGNVRQLRNVARYLGSRATLPRISPRDPELERLLGAPSERSVEGLGEVSGQTTTPPRASATQMPRRAPANISDDEIGICLRQHDWRLGPTAKALGMSRATLNERVDRHPSLRRAQSLTAEDIRAAQEACEDDSATLWQQLKVSKRSLTLRMRALGL